MNDTEERKAALQAAALAADNTNDVLPLAEEYLAWLKGGGVTAQDGGGNGNGPPPR